MSKPKFAFESFIPFLFLSISAGTAVSAQTFATVATFTDSTDPEGDNSLIVASDGNFYGTTKQGGANGRGTVYKMTPAGAITTLYSFDALPLGLSGAPASGIIQTSDGNFYGVTIGGGVNSNGTLFKITPSGSFTLISSLPQGHGQTVGMTLGTDGAFYGTNQAGGNESSTEEGSIFKLTPYGVQTSVYGFMVPPVLGGDPHAIPTQGSDGNLYGTTAAYGADPSQCGTIFKLTASGSLTVLHNFTGADGCNSYAQLIQAKDGTFYGTTTKGGASGNGTVFKITPDGTFTSLHSFTGTDGMQPYSRLLQASDGNFYGVTMLGGTSTGGTVYSITAAGVFTNIHNFAVGGGVVPRCGLIQGADGFIYGTTERGGANNAATIFKIGLGAPVSPAGPTITPGGIVSASAYGEFSSVTPGGWIEIYGSNLSATTRGWAASDFNGNNAPTMLDGVFVSIAGQPAFVEYISPGEINVLLPSTLPTGSQQLTVTSGGVTTVAYTVTVNALEPGMLAPPSFDIGGVQYAVGIFSDGAYALPAGAIAGVTSRPAKPGDTLTLYGVGFGPVTPSGPAGVLVQGLTSLASDFQVSVGGVAAAVPFAGLAPGFTALYQFNVMVPSVPAGNQPLTFTLGGGVGTQTLLLPIGN